MTTSQNSQYVQPKDTFSEKKAKILANSNTIENHIIHKPIKVGENQYVIATYDKQHNLTGYFRQNHK